MAETQETKITSDAREAADAIVLFLIDGWDKRYITIERLREATGITGHQLTNGVRQLCTSVGALRYSRRGEYEIVDLQRYFDPTDAGAYDRYHRRYL